jgi:hypothetical protein
MGVVGQSEAYILHNKRPLTTTLHTLLSIRACIRVSCYTGSLLANRLRKPIFVLVDDCCLKPTQELFSYRYIMARTSYTFQLDDVRFVLDEHAYT